jgi:hypothetical protein
MFYVHDQPLHQCLYNLVDAIDLNATMTHIGIYSHLSLRGSLDALYDNGDQISKTTTAASRSNLESLPELSHRRRISKVLAMMPLFSDPRVAEWSTLSRSQLVLSKQM